MCIACGDDENNESVTDPSKNTTDIAVTGIVDKYGCTYANISGYANLNLLPATGSGNPEIGIELYKEQEVDKEITSSMTGNRFSVRFNNLYPDSEYKYRSFVKYGGLTYYGEYRTFTTKKLELVQSGSVDLGLSVKWASHNVGASSPEGYGGYYAWGETEEKSIYDRDTYKYDNDNPGYINIDSNISGTQYDVAHVKWGGSWRMPTLSEILELINNCTWKWTTYNGVNGQLVTGPNGNSIFLPAAGVHNGKDFIDRGSDGYYWSASLIEGLGNDACSLSFDSGHYRVSYWYRDCGYSVRPVTD